MVQAGEYSWKDFEKKKKKQKEGAGRRREHGIGCSSTPPQTSHRACQPANQEPLHRLKDAREKKKRRRRGGEFKRREGVRDDECAAAVDLQPLQFVQKHVF